MESRPQHRSQYLFAAVEPTTGVEVARILHTISAAAISRFPAELSANLALHVHTVLVLDRAGWHGARALVGLNNLLLVSLPPCSPEFNLVERLWLYLRERYISRRLSEDYNAIGEARLAPLGPLQLRRPDAASRSPAILGYHTSGNKRGG